MNKAALVGKVANEIRLTKKACQIAVDKIISAITSSLTKGEKVTLVSFGTFQAMERKARKGKNLQTGETIQIPAKKVPKFVLGKNFREKM